ncbi:MAG: replicative DNA helicase [Cyclobacteriaceae bacterium]
MYQIAKNTHNNGRANLIPRSSSLFKLDRPMPHDSDIEAAVLGAIIQVTNSICDVAHFLRPDHFYNDSYGQMYKACIDLFAQSRPIDMLTLKHSLQTSGILEIVGGAMAISELTSRVSNSKNIERHARIVVELYIKRKVIETCTLHTNQGLEDGVDAFELKDSLESEIFKLSTETESKVISSVGELKKQSLAPLKSASQGNIKFAGVGSGFTNFDRVTAGFRNSDLIILAARPGMGKSALMTSMLRNMGVILNVPVACFSLEMPKLQLMNRLYSAEAEVESDKVFQMKLQPFEYDTIEHKAGVFHNAPIYFDDNPSLTPMELRSKLRKLIMMHKIQIAFVDYLQLMKVDRFANTGNREQEVAYISRSLKEIAKEFDIPIIALSSLNRAVELRPNKRPMLADLRESGGIESDADVVIFLYRDEYYKIETDVNGLPTMNVAELIIAKNRNGKLDNDIRLKFIGKYQKFTDWTHNY